MDYPAALAIGVCLGLPIAVLSAALGQGKAAAAAMEGIARQPDAAGDIRGSLIISLALIESLVIYSLLIFFLMFSKLPSVMDYLGKVSGAQ